MIYSYIQDHKDEYSVVKMCQVLEVSKSGFYKWACQQAQDDRTERTAWREELKRMIAKSYHESLGTYGSPRILEDLKEWGYSVCERTVGRLMKEMGLRCTRREIHDDNGFQP